MARVPAFAPAIPFAVAAWRLRALLRSFYRLQAVSPASAVTAAALKTHEGVVLRRLVRQGIVVSPAQGLFYLDAARHSKWRSTRRRRAVIIIGLLAIFLAVGWFTGWLRP